MTLQWTIFNSSPHKHICKIDSQHVCAHAWHMLGSCGAVFMHVHVMVVRMFVFICGFLANFEKMHGWMLDACVVLCVRVCVSSCMYECICVTVCLGAYELHSPCTNVQILMFWMGVKNTRRWGSVPEMDMRGQTPHHMHYWSQYQSH